MTFDDYWEANWTPSQSMPPVFDIAMREIANRAWTAAIEAERDYWKNAMAVMLVSRSGQVTEMGLADRLAKIVAEDRSNHEATGRAPGKDDK